MSHSSRQYPSTEHLPTPSDIHALHDNIPVAIDASSPTDASPTTMTPCPKPLEPLDNNQREASSAFGTDYPYPYATSRLTFHGSGWSPEVITALGDVLCEFADVFFSSKFRSRRLLPYPVQDFRSTG